MSEETGLRYNGNKPLLNFVMSAPHALAGLASVMEFGSRKYSRDNWKKGLPHLEVVDSLLRHIAAYVSGEDKDSESGLPHVDHMLCNAFFLSELIRTHPHMDGREMPKPEPSCNGFIPDYHNVIANPYLQAR